MPTLAGLATPSLWILGGEDSSLPSEATLETLRRLQAEGKPIEYLVYPHAEHGIMRFKDAADGERHYLGYEPGYFRAGIDWLRKQSAL